MAGFTIAVLVSDQSVDLDIWKNLQEKHNYNLVVFRDLKPFVQFCSEGQPDLIAVSLHHPYEKIKSLPLSLRKALSLPVLCFAEREDASISSEFAKHPKDQIVDVVLDELSFWEAFSNLLSSEKRIIKDQLSAKDSLALIEKIYTLNGDQESFGKIKITDQSETLREQRNRKTAQIKADQKKKVGLLIEACQLALKKNFNSVALQKSSDFQTRTSFVALIEMENFKGFLSLACNKGEECPVSLANVLFKNIESNLKDWGLIIEMSIPYLIQSQTSEFVKTYSGFSEFVIHHKSENQKDWALSFVKREAIQPSYVLSEDKKMLRMDIKSLPPQTALPFDVYIYLPKNQKYVRYLKQGSSISLEQVKRHSKDSEKSHVYVPINSEDELVRFFIQNTINWELTIETQDFVA